MPPAPLKTRISELFGLTARGGPKVNWTLIAAEQHCPFLGRKCLKVRKSQPEISIGSCSVLYGREPFPVVICPHRMLERRQVFTDCIHLLSLHEPGNELHVVGEIPIPGGNVDFFLVSARDGRVLDFVGIEIQTLDTTGTVWPERQRFLDLVGVSVPVAETESRSTFGMNWKMTAKTILVQLHHKVETFEHIRKHLVLVIQNRFFNYMRREFQFGQLHAPARVGDPMHIHSYSLGPSGSDLRLSLQERCSTDSAGIAACLNLQDSPILELEEIVASLESRISDRTLIAP